MSLYTSYSSYALGIPLVAIAGIALYTLLAGTGEYYFNIGYFLENSSPYAWACIGIGMCIGLSVMGAAW